MKDNNKSRHDLDGLVVVGKSLNPSSKSKTQSEIVSTKSVKSDPITAESSDITQETKKKEVLYWKREDVRDVIKENVIPQLQNIKQEKLESLLWDIADHMNIMLASSIEYRNDYCLIEKYRNEIAIAVKDKYSRKENINVDLYNMLLDEVDNCLDLPAGNGDRYGWDIVQSNQNYFCAFSEFIGCVHSNLEQIL